MTKETETLCLEHAEETQLKNQTPTQNASVESPEQTWVSNSGTEGELEELTPKELKERISFSDFLKRENHYVIKSGKWKKILCPFHHERTASFCVDDEACSARCFGCGWYGDIYDFVMEDRDLGFRDAFIHIAGKASQSPKAVGAKKPSKIAKRKGISLTKQETETIQAACKKLADHEHLWDRVASKRGWKPETIKKLADEGVLGWNQGALAFIYETGMKLRNWPHRDFLWEFGVPSVWRRGQIGEATEVFICEGETDAISLIDKGLVDDPTIAVIALPSASTITEDLSILVSGKNVTLCMDNDEAGERATEKLIELLEPVCASLQTFNFEEVA